jgi:hypothetical protein
MKNKKDSKLTPAEEGSFYLGFGACFLSMLTFAICMPHSILYQAALAIACIVAWCIVGKAIVVIMREVRDDASDNERMKAFRAKQSEDKKDGEEDAV